MPSFPPPFSEYNSRIIVEGALNDKLPLSFPITSICRFGEVNMLPGNHLMAFQLDLKHYVKVLKSNDSGKIVYEGYDSNLAARTFVIILGPKDAIRAVAQAVKIYNKCGTKR